MGRLQAITFKKKHISMIKYILAVVMVGWVSVRTQVQPFAGSGKAMLTPPYL